MSFQYNVKNLRIGRLTLFFVVTTPFACWFLWRAYYVEDFKWRLGFQFGVAFWRVILREVYFEGPNRFGKASKTSILNTGRQQAYKRSSFYVEWMRGGLGEPTHTLVSLLDTYLGDGYNLCPFQGTQICALLTYFFHHVEWDGNMWKTSQLFPTL
jgi:hypothetical protein